MYGVNQMMMIRPHDGGYEEAEGVAEEDGGYFEEGGERGLGGGAELEDHDGDDDGDDSVAEGLKAAGGHLAVGHGKQI